MDNINYMAVNIEKRDGIPKVFIQTDEKSVVYDKIKDGEFIPTLVSHFKNNTKALDLFSGLYNYIELWYHGYFKDCSYSIFYKYEKGSLSKSKVRENTSFEYKGLVNRRETVEMTKQICLTENDHELYIDVSTRHYDNKPYRKHDVLSVIDTFFCNFIEATDKK